MHVSILALILLLVPAVRAAEFRVPKATVLTLSLGQELDARKVKKGKEFKAHLYEPVIGEAGRVLIPAGCEAKGKIEDADDRHLTLKFRQIKTPFGKKSLDARLVGVDAESVRLDGNEVESPSRSAGKKVAGAGTTSVGIVKGGIAGAAVKGIGRILFGGDKDLKLKKGTLLRIELKKDLKL